MSKKRSSYPSTIVRYLIGVARLVEREPHAQREDQLKKAKRLVLRHIHKLEDRIEFLSTGEVDR